MIDIALEEEAYMADTPSARRILALSVLQERVSFLDQHEPVCVEPSTPVATAIDSMLRHRVGCVLVVDGGALVGIFTERDVLLKTLETEIDPRRTAVSNLMTASPRTIRDHATIAEALARMSRGGFRHLPVVDGDGSALSVISVKDIVYLIAEYFSCAVLTVPPRPGLDVPRSREGA